MQFILGVIVGLIIAILIFAILAFLRLSIERRVKIIQTLLENTGPRPQGYVIEPEDETDIIRKNIIEKNRKEGKDTRIEDLM